MVLDFEDKTYETFGQRLLYCYCKMGYVGLKYKFYYKILFIIENIIEVFFLMFFIMTNQNDFFNIKIKTYGNYFNSNFDKTQFNYTNLDQNISYLFNFFDIINKLSLSTYYIPFVVIIIVMAIKFAQFCYFLKAKVSVISVSIFKRFWYHIFSLVDQILKTFGDIIILTITFSMFSCTKDPILAAQILKNSGNDPYL